MVLVARESLLHSVQSLTLNFALPSFALHFKVRYQSKATLPLSYIIHDPCKSIMFYNWNFDLKNWFPYFFHSFHFWKKGHKSIFSQQNFSVEISYCSTKSHFHTFETSCNKKAAIRNMRSFETTYVSVTKKFKCEQSPNSTHTIIFP